jgi:hypothetical protein
MRVWARLSWLLRTASAGWLLFVSGPAFNGDPGVIFEDGFEFRELVLGLQSPIGPLRGGDTVTLTYTVVPGSQTISQLTFEVALDGTAFTPDRDLTPAPGTFDWLVPIVDEPAARLRLVATVTGVNDSFVVTTESFAIDSTPPQPPDVALVSTTPTNDPVVRVTVASCADRDGVVLMPDAVTAASGFVACDTTPSALTLTLSEDGLYDALRAYAVDLAGNVSAPSPALSVLFDAARAEPSFHRLAAVGDPVDIGWND